MATQNLPTPQLQPIEDEKNLLADDGGSCCGGSSCSIN